MRAARPWLVPTLLVIAAVALVLFRFPFSVQFALGALTNFLNLAILLLSVTALAGFVYAVYLRKLLRARRIRAIRMKRALREAAERRRA